MLLSIGYAYKYNGTNGTSNAWPFLPNITAILLTSVHAPVAPSARAHCLKQSFKLSKLKRIWPIDALIWLDLTDRCTDLIGCPSHVQPIGPPLVADPSRCQPSICNGTAVWTAAVESPGAKLELLIMRHSWHFVALGWYPYSCCNTKSNT